MCPPLSQMWSWDPLSIRVNTPPHSKTLSTQYLHSIYPLNGDHLSVGVGVPCLHPHVVTPGHDVARLVHQQGPAYSVYCIVNIVFCLYYYHVTTEPMGCPPSAAPACASSTAFCSSNLASVISMLQMVSTEATTFQMWNVGQDT